MSLQLAEDIIKGRRLKRGEDLSFLLSEDLDELCAGADKIRKELCGNHVDLCSIINGRSGRCGEDCKFCAQSACHHAKVEEYPFLEPEEILEDCKRHEAKKVHRYSIVTAGRALTGAEMEKALQAYRAMKKECKVELCASHGLLSQEDFNRLKEAGVDGIMPILRLPGEISRISVQHIHLRTSWRSSGARRRQDFPSVPAASSAWEKPGKTGSTWRSR